MTKKKGHWYDKEIMEATIKWENIQLRGEPHIPITESEYHKAISARENGAVKSTGFFDKLAAGKYF